MENMKNRYEVKLSDEEFALTQANKMTFNLFASGYKSSVIDRVLRKHKNKKSDPQIKNIYTQKDFISNAYTSHPKNYVFYTK